MNSSVTTVWIFALALVLHNASRPASARQGSLTPTGLRCEYLVDPLGIDASAALPPRLSWTLVAADATVRGRVQTAYQILVDGSPEALAEGKGTLWNSGKVPSDATAQIAYAGTVLPARARAFWKVRAWDNDDQPSEWSAPALWSVGLLAPADWGGAEWIGDPTPPPLTGPDPLPAVMLRKAFRAGEGSDLVARATLYATALGLYELRLNGKNVGDGVLAPEWTDYAKRVQYQTYDVTPLVRGGDNVLGAVLGDGWYAGRIGLSFIVKDGPVRAIYGRKTRLMLRLDLEFSSGTTRTIVTDGSWQCTTEGPIRVADMLDGVVFDARREMPGWDAAGFVPSESQGWRAARVFEPVRAAIVPQPNDPVRITHSLRPNAVTEPKPGAFVFDLGQNMVGCCRLSLPAGAVDPGATVTLRHAEVLNPDGTIFTANLRSASATDRYIARGPGAETFEPRFTYHGFRYVEVTGLKAKPASDLITGLAFNSAPREVGAFACSDPMLNRLIQNILWTQRGNMQSVPTDCPQRDERLGWMGDILAFGPAACFNMDMAAFLAKWFQDVRDAQAADGRFADFSPHPFNPDARFSGTPAWGDAGVVVPWVAYQYYGDTRVLDHQYDAAKRWVDYVRSKNPDLLWKNARGNDYGDWLTTDTFKIEGFPKTGADTPHDVFGTIFFFHSADLLSRMAGVLGHDDDAKTYADLAGAIRAAFNSAYVKPDGTIEGGTQGSYALALQFGLLPENLHAQTAKHMVDGFAPYRGHLSTGFHSTGPLMFQLVESGYLDDAYRLLMSRTMPSWGYPIDHGATTIWERWDGHVEGRGFQDAGMNSFSHFAFGAVAEWMYRTVVGIQPDPASPGFKHFTIRPRPGGGLTWAEGSYESIRGSISCGWRIREGRVVVKVSIPPNTTATVFVPTSDARAVTESGVAAATSRGVEFVRAQVGAAVFELGSGRYTFEAPYQEKATP